MAAAAAENSVVGDAGEAAAVEMAVNRETAN
jgi:hypothetical protein